MATFDTHPNMDYYATTLRHEHDSGLRKDTNASEALNSQRFPLRYTGERVWNGADMALEDDQWITVMSEDDKYQLMKALNHFKEMDLEPGDLTTETFPLPTDLCIRLKNISGNCYSGRGFGILRGLPGDSLTKEDRILLFGGVSCHVAPERGFQDKARTTVTCHVISEDSRPGAKEHNLKPAFTNGRLAFHTDLGDILALYSIAVADTGGKTVIASSSQIYNELADTRPDLLEELKKPWVFYQSQDYDTDGTPLITNAVDDKLVFQFSRLPITGFRGNVRNQNIPSPSARRLEAMNLIEELAWKNSFALPCQAGDVAFINNLCMMHGRTAFDLDEDGNALLSNRHLVKLMLRDPDLAWKLPESLKWLPERIYGPNQTDGTRTEEWQLSVEIGDSLPAGHVWAGTGGFANG